MDRLEMADLFSQEIHSKEDYEFCERTAILIADYASRTDKHLKESLIVISLLHKYHTVDESLIEEFANDLTDSELEALLILSNPNELSQESVNELRNNKLASIVILASKIEEVKLNKTMSFTQKASYLNQVSLLNLLIGEDCKELNAQLEAQINYFQKILWNSFSKN